MASEKYKKLPVVDEAGASRESPPPPYPVKIQPSSHPVCYTEARPEPQMGPIYFAIFALICCFWPLGLVALLKAIKGMQAHYKGDLQSSKSLNQSAKRWSIASIVVLVIIYMLVFMFYTAMYLVNVIVLGDFGTNSTMSDHHHWGKGDYNKWTKAD